MLLDCLCRVEGGSIPEHDVDPPFIRPGLWLHPVNSPGRPMCVQVLQSTKPTAVEPQCSVVPSRQTGPV